MGISQNSNTTPSLSAAADLTSWLCELNEQVDGALADLAHTMQSVHSGCAYREFRLKNVAQLEVIGETVSFHTYVAMRIMWQSDPKRAVSALPWTS